MAQQTPPYVVSAATHSAALFRQANDGPFVRRGVLGASEYGVTQQASPNMSVQVGAGRVMIPGTQGVVPVGFTWSTQGSYFAENDASATVTIAASNPTNPRIDVVYVAVQDAFYSGSNNQVVLAVATGTPSVSPAVPAIPANATALANIAVGANVSTIVNANISNKASLTSAIAICLGGIIPVTGSSAYPTSPYVGQYVDDATLGLLRWDGAKWQIVSGSARLQYTHNNNGQPIPATTYTPLTGFTQDVDTLGGFNTSTGVWTCPVDGSYEVSGQISVAQGPTRVIAGIGSAAVQLQRAETVVPATGGSVVTVGLVAKERAFSQGDTLALLAWAGSATTAATSNNVGAFLRIKRVG